MGGGVIGLSIALALKQKGMTARVLCRNFQEAASLSAAGMLAPQAEGLSAGAMRDLCIQSRDLYPTWVKDLEAIGQCSTGYWASGILAPALNDPDSSPFNHDRKQWADGSKMRTIQPTLSDEVKGGWWFPEDAQVDNRKLYLTLQAVVNVQNIPIQIATVTKFIRDDERITSLMTTDGELKAQHYVLATGAWSEELLPIPVKPRKGQMLAVTMPMDDGLPVKTVLFGEEIYLVPRQDGRLVIGATSEDVGFLSGNTPLGIMQLLQNATRLVPAIADWPVEEFWYGYRPVTPDDLPILGESQYRNLTYATGHGRNGILLTPMTGKLIADWITTQTSNSLLDAFHWSRLIP